MGLASPTNSVIPETSTLETNHPIDAFLQVKRDEICITAAPPAPHRILIRRMFLDLTGLMPTLQELERWEQAMRESPDRSLVVAKLIEVLLASPHYGERWAQHWLDVVRYADTGGMSNDYERSNAWRYRDYVVRAFNADKPYDRFIVEQIAGDELADESIGRRLPESQTKLHQARLDGAYTPEETQWLVASGFLRMGPWDNAMIKEPEARQIFLDDLVNATGQTFLGLTLRCVKCHDHKFDPIPTRDYYRIYAALSTTQLAERSAPFLKEENQVGFETGRLHVQAMLDHAVGEKTQLINLREMAAQAWYASRGIPYLSLEERQGLPDEAKPPRGVGLNYIQQGQLKVREQDEWIWKRRMERYLPMIQSVYCAAQTKMAWNAARRLRLPPEIDSTNPAPNYILMGGALDSQGEKVVPGVLSALALPVNHQPNASPYILDQATSGRRLALARWIAHPENGLASRAFINRVWQHHFGIPLAPNPNNIGASGGKPTHPELLDWLANKWISQGRRVKDLHRWIMTSRAYQMSSRHAEPDMVAQKDPENQFLSQFAPRQMTAEEMRDNMLLASGELNLAMGGLPIYPEMNREVAFAPRMIQFSLAPAYQASPSKRERHRRSLYRYRTRGLPDPFMEVFHQPEASEACERRLQDLGTPQALSLLNSETMQRRSLALAAKVVSNHRQIKDQVNEAFARAVCRTPSDEESEHCIQYVQKMIDYHQSNHPEPNPYPTKLTRSLVEEFSGKAFEYDEHLPAYEHFQYDLQANEASPPIRALADLCLLLFNTNEFLVVE